MTPLLAFALGALLALAVMLAAVAIGAHIARARALRASGQVPPPQYRGHVPPKPLPPRHTA
jgi:UPF0716 family protein affecting phage T7 exclusion